MQASTTVASEPQTVRPARVRDPRLDFFRGVGMLIILIAHVPFDGWALWIPARFGFSDATEMFVFQSGMASAIAFGGTFDRGGWVPLLARVARRIWQIYWAHIAVFVCVVAILALAGQRPEGGTYLESLNLVPFLKDPAGLLAGLLTLQYVPNYFDILPMYMVLLALLPVMLAAERMHPLAPMGLVLLLWLAAQAGINLPAEPWSDRPWFFNPLGWQACFFVGFFLMRGRLPVPPRSRRLVLIALFIVIATIPFAWSRLLDSFAPLHDAALALLPLTDKTHFGLFRMVHFLALAYLAVLAAGPRGSRLTGRVAQVLTVVGQQSLAVFVTGMVLAQVLGIVLDHMGRDPGALAVVNLAGFAIMIGTAYLVRWFKSGETSKARG